MKSRSSVVVSAYAKVIFKLLVVGFSNSGKSSLILRYVKDIFRTLHNGAEGIEFYSSTVSFAEEEVALQIWDTVLLDRDRLVLMLLGR